MSFKIQNRQVLPSEQVKNDKNIKNRIKDSSKRVAFEQMLNDQINKKSDVKLSSRTQQRLEQRNIQLNEDDMKIINNAIKNAEAKGSRELLLLYRDTAFITSVKNNTIITAVDTENAQDNVFTNIDSAIVINK